MVGQHLDDDGAFVSNALIDQSAQQMLDELYKWTGALTTLRTPVVPAAHAAERAVAMA
jgi:hypothetical protein